MGSTFPSVARSHSRDPRGVLAITLRATLIMCKDGPNPSGSCSLPEKYGKCSSCKECPKNAWITLVLIGAAVWLVCYGVYVIGHREVQFASFGVAEPDAHLFNLRCKDCFPDKHPVGKASETEAPESDSAFASPLVSWLSDSTFSADFSGFADGVVTVTAANTAP